MKGGTYVINLEEYRSVGTHWIAFYLNWSRKFSETSLKVHRKQNCHIKYS